jgi:transcriptional regulator GlxA family with amidase domain
MVMRIINKVLNSITDYKPDDRINAQLKKNHLTTIEMAKEYMMQNFTSDVSLMELAKHCFVSPFHFSRLFRIFTNVSPHQFLLSLRLKHAEMLLQNTTLPVADIAFSSGFNSTEHFSAAFRNRYECSPAKFRSTFQDEITLTNAST